ncbi:MAG TPA: DUF2231 domain-containing protein [Pseudonocardiaceae bacterium]|jgi:hypothetical protein|nr:DUF2231 domain-containing protein [Pseudonocardiaceae bacterium]
MATFASPSGWTRFIALNSGFLTVAGVPAHPLVVAAVAVLLPLAAVCSVGLAVHRGFRRRFGAAVLILTALAVAAVPLAQYTGTQLTTRLRATDPLIARHVELGNQLLPYALGFGVAVVILLVAGKLADRERAAEESSARTWQRISTLLSVLVVAMAVITTVQVVRIGTTGAQAVWQQVGG